MPLALDPEQTFDLVLKSDQDKPAAERPTFTFRYLANREWKVIAHLADHLDEAAEQGLDALLGRMEEVLKMALVGWRNMIDPATGEEIPFDPNNLDRIINPAEMSELIIRVRDESVLSVEDKKKSGSPSPSGSGASARSVTRPKHAKGRPRSKNRS